MLWKSDRKVGGERLAIIGVDCSLVERGEASPARHYLGQGKVTSALLDELARLALALKAEDSQVAILLAVHFSPRHPGESERLRLIDEDRLIQAAADLEIGHVLCGHYHEAVAYTTASPILRCHSADSVSHCAEVRNGFHMLRVVVDAGVVRDVSRSDYFWSVYEGDWSESPPR